MNYKENVLNDNISNWMTLISDYNNVPSRTGKTDEEN